MKLELLGILAIQYLSYCYDLELRFSKLTKAYLLSDHSTGLTFCLSLLNSTYQSFLVVVGEIYYQLLKGSYNNVIFFKSWVEMGERGRKVG